MARASGQAEGSWFFRLFHLPPRTGPDAGFPLGRLRQGDGRDGPRPGESASAGLHGQAFRTRARDTARRALLHVEGSLLPRVAFVAPVVLPPVSLPTPAPPASCRWGRSGPRSRA